MLLLLLLPASVTQAREANQPVEDSATVKAHPAGNQTEGSLAVQWKKFHEYYTRLITGKEEIKAEVLRKVVPVLLVLIILMTFSLLIIVSCILIVKSRRMYVEKKRKQTGRKYLKIIAEYLVKRKQPEYPTFHGLFSILNRRILINQIYSLSQALFGDKQNKLLKLFRIRVLLRHVLINIALYGKSRKALYIKLFSVILLNRTLYQKFQKYAHSQHHELRLYTQLAILNYNPEALPSLLDDYPHYFSLWDQIHFLEVIDRRSTVPPDFYHYLQHPNHTVVIFGLRMIRIFYQKNEKEYLITQLLAHPNEQVRYEALKTATDLYIENMNKLLLAYLSEVNDQYKTLIIRFLIQNNLLDHDELLRFFYEERDEHDKFSILKAIYNNYQNGKETVEQIRSDADEPQTKDMCNFILENAI